MIEKTEKCRIIDIALCSIKKNGNNIVISPINAVKDKNGKLFFLTKNEVKLYFHSTAKSRFTIA